MLQIDNRNNLDLGEDTYLEIISRKTASLCATCCLLGATYAGATEARILGVERTPALVGHLRQLPARRAVRPDRVEAGAKRISREARRQAERAE